jgi:hypothetical protein
MPARKSTPDLSPFAGAVANRVKLDDARRRKLLATSETELYELVRQWAQQQGWLIYHTYDARRSYAGFPDTVFVRPPRIVYAELKREDGRVTREQWAWFDALKASGAEVYIWRPSDIETGVIDTLR